jgi:hypothetical protein
MNHQRLVPSSIAMLAVLGTAAGQSFVVSPLGLDLVEGSGSNNYPWMATPRHYMQIHSDLKLTARVIKALAWRRDGAATIGTGTRTIDMELWLGHSVDYDRASFVYAQNYTLLPSQLCLTRQNVNIGPMTGTGTPAPFEIVIPLTTPFVYLGIASLAWEAAVYGNVQNGTFAASSDAHSGLLASSGTTSLGAGCTVTGKASAMVLSTQAADNGGVFALATYLDYAPNNQPAVIAVGATNPSLSIPGLCSPLYTDLQATLFMGVTDATGYIGAGGTKSAGGGGVFLFPNVFGGANLYVQAHALDPAATAIQIANSDGRMFTAPLPNLSRVVKVTRLFSNDPNPLQPHALFTSSGTMSYCIVTQFSY